MRPGIVHCANRGRHQHRDRRPAEIHQRQDKNGEHRHLDFFGFDLLADIFRRAADHQPGDEDRNDDEQQHAVHAGADAADDDFAELDVDQRNHAAERGEAVVHGVDRAARRRGGDNGEQRRGDDAETHLLAFHIAAGQPERVERVIAMRLGGVAGDDAGDEQDAHHGKDGPALLLIADHAAEHIGERRAERKDRNDLHVVRQRGRILERMRSIGVEKAAAIGAEHLNRDLRGDRTDCDRLLGAFQRGRVDIGTERLRDALPDQEQRVGHANRQQDVERATRDIDPEAADRAHGMPRKAADQCHREHDAGRRREIVLMRQAEHLHEIRERAFATVVLPVGIGDEAHRRVERQIFGYCGLLGRIERQEGLQPHQRVNDEKPPT